MKSIKDFKERMIIGASVNSKLYRKDHKGEYILQQELEGRICTNSQSNSFACSVPGTDKSSWADWPKKDEFTILDPNTVQIDRWGTIRLVYQFIMS